VYPDRRLQKIHARLQEMVIVKSTKKLLIISLTEIERITRNTQYVQGQYPDYEVSVLIPEKATATFDRFFLRVLR
jgi:hypothetical protein